MRRTGVSREDHPRVAEEDRAISGARDQVQSARYVQGLEAGGEGEWR